jgi:hypothetical protein
VVKNHNEIISASIDGKTLSQLLLVLKKFNLNFDYNFFNNLEESLDRLYRINLREICGNSTPDQLDMIKARTVTEYEFKGYLASLGNHVIYDKNFTTVENLESEFLINLKLYLPPNIILLSNIVKGTLYDHELERRVYVEEDIYRLLDLETGSYMDFSEPEPREYVHVFIFNVPLELQGNAFRSLRLFKMLFDLLMAPDPTVKGLESMVLKDPRGSPEVRGKEWRNRPFKGSYKLKEFWRLAGAVFPLEHDPDRAYFHHTK